MSKKFIRTTALLAFAQLALSGALLANGCPKPGYSVKHCKEWARHNYAGCLDHCEKLYVSGQYNGNEYQVCRSGCKLDWPKIYDECNECAK